jgi:glutamate-1-semialdehyde 2,1-aminomutase
MVNKLEKIGENRIPGFSQLLSKRPDQFSREFWPKYYSKAKGTHIWDLDGKKYLDFSFSGIGANVLGYADADVNREVKKAIDMGSSSSINCSEEAQLAEVLCKMHKWADMVRYARSGGEAVSIAIRIARTYSQKDKVLFCGYHGWSDWYLASNINAGSNLDNHLLPSLKSTGVPKGLEGTAIPFNYNNLEEFKLLFNKHIKDLGCVIMEPVRTTKPENGFLEIISKMCKTNNVPLIFDEISSGFRICSGGSHLKFKVNPDIAVFAKAIGNGFPISAIIGSQKIMSSAQDTFISSTNWTERTGSVAALATIKKFQNKNVHKHLHRMGKQVQNFWKEMSDKYNLDLEVSGLYQLSYMSFKKDNDIKKTFFVEQMLNKYILASTRYYPNFAQNDSHFKKYKKAAEPVFKEINLLSKDGNQDLIKAIKGSVSKPGFKRYA